MKIPTGIIIFFLYSCFVYEVISLSIIDGSIFSGSIPIKNSCSIFYILYSAKAKVENPPLVIWISNGKGFSSMHEIIKGIGPFELNSKNFSLSKKNYGWDTLSDILFIDHPIGNGYSNCSAASEYSKNYNEVANNLFIFLQGFAKRFPSYSKKESYISGYEYSGKIIPILLNRIMKEANPFLKFKEAIIFSPIINEFQQILSLHTYSVRKLKISFKSYLISFASELSTIALLKTGYSERAYEFLSNIPELVGRKERNKFSKLNIKENCTFYPDCKYFGDVESYYNLPQVMQQLKVNSHYSQNNEYINKRLFEYTSDKTLDHIEESLNIYGIRYTFVIGKDSYNANYLGQYSWIKYLNKFKNILKEPSKVFYSNGTIQGSFRNLGKLNLYVLDNNGFYITNENPHSCMEIYVKAIYSRE